MISIKNVYYLLLYAWDVFADGEMAAVDAEPDTDLVNLMAAVLARGIDGLLRRGLDRGYLPVIDTLPAIRGKLNVSATVKANQLASARVTCEYDEMSSDILHNRILKTTLFRLLRSQLLAASVHRRVRLAYKCLPPLTPIRLTDNVFRVVQLHRNIRCYRLLLDICRLLLTHLIPDEAHGRFQFRDFTRDEEVMRKLFERFLFRFYKHEQSAFKVQRSRFPWAGAMMHLPGLLPSMHTDLTLIQPGRQLVIDAKYTANVLQRHPHGSPTLRSAHLYQLFAYLKNIPATGAGVIDGMILYPLAHRHIDSTFFLSGHHLRVFTIDLNQHWTQIRRDLLALLSANGASPPPKHSEAAEFQATRA